MDPEVRTFIRQSVPSVLALEVLLFLREHSAQTWTPESLATALRNSPGSCASIMSAFAGQSLLARGPRAMPTSRDLTRSRA